MFDLTMIFLALAMLISGIPPTSRTTAIRWYECSPSTISHR